MIPVKLDYPPSLTKRFHDDFSWFYEFYAKYSNNAQFLILATEEYVKYLKELEVYRAEIEDVFSGRCLYCGTKNIDAILPLHPIDKNKEFPALVQEIKNIVPLCQQCKKVTAYFDYENTEEDFLYYFTKINGRSAERITFDSLINRRPNVLVPTQEPSHLNIKIIVNSGKLVGSNPYAKKIISICSLNSPRKSSERKVLLNDLKMIGDVDFEYLKLWTCFKSYRESVFKDYSYAEELQVIDHGYYNEDERYGLVADIEPRRIEDKLHHQIERVIERINRDVIDDPIECVRFSFSGLRSIDSGEVDLDGIKALGVIGENGVGKSTLLNFMSMFARGTRYSEVVKSSDGFMSSKIKFPNGSFVGKKKDNYYNNRLRILSRFEGGFLCEGEIEEKVRMAYISDARVNRESIKRAGSWLLGLYEAEFDEVASRLKEVLGINYDSNLIRMEDGVVVMNEDGSIKKIEDLSSGYKSILLIIYSIHVQFGKTYRASSEYIHLSSVVGLVFIDEIDLHLHPVWKINIVSRLKRIFPDILFIFTTHDPLVLKGCVKKEVLLLKRDDLGTVYMSQDLPDLSGYDVEKILTSSYFGLGTSSDVESNNLLLDLSRSITGEDDDAVNDLIRELKYKNQYGASYRDMIAYLCVDKSLADNKEINFEKIVDVINKRVGSND